MIYEGRLMILSLITNRHPELDSRSVDLEKKSSSVRQLLNQVQHDVGEMTYERFAL